MGVEEFLKLGNKEIQEYLKTHDYRHLKFSNLANLKRDRKIRKRQKSVIWTAYWTESSPTGIILLMFPLTKDVFNARVYMKVDSRTKEVIGRYYADQTMLFAKVIEGDTFWDYNRKDWKWMYLH